MRYWDVDQPEWDVAEREFAAAWQRQPKWVASRTLASVGPNATLIRGDLDAFVRDLKATVDGELDVAGPELAAAVAPLIDEYRLYLRPYARRRQAVLRGYAAAAALRRHGPHRRGRGPADLRPGLRRYSIDGPGELTAWSVVRR